MGEVDLLILVQKRLKISKNGAAHFTPLSSKCAPRLRRLILKADHFGGI